MNHFTDPLIYRLTLEPLSQKMKQYRLDKTFGKAQTFAEADNNRDYWLKKDVKDRLSAAWHLISCAYGLSLDNPPRIDKNVFSMRKHRQ